MKALTADKDGNLHESEINVNNAASAPYYQRQRELTLQEILDYEIRGSIIAQFVGVGWLQDIIAKHYAKKAVRKYKRYKHSKEMEAKIKSIL